MYEKLYYYLFNEISVVIEKLQEIQLKAEEMYITRQESDENGAQGI